MRKKVNNFKWSSNLEQPMRYLKKCWNNIRQKMNHFYWIRMRFVSSFSTLFLTVSIVEYTGKIYLVKFKEFLLGITENC